MRAGSAVEKDVLCRILFLNLRVDNEKVASYLWNEPFASLVKATELSYGGAEATSFERMIADLAEWFIANPTNIWRQELRQAAGTISEQSYRY